MISSFSSLVPSARSARGTLSRRFALLLASSLLSAAVFAQPPAEGDANARGRGNFDPAQMQQQQMDRMREQLGITDDAEWKLISDRVNAVMELRRAGGPGLGGFGGGRGGPGGPGGGGGRGGRGGANPEQEALRQAIADKLPDAEVKSRLERFRDVRKASEEKLTKAQEELRAVLSVRQEAVAVMAGLLP
jgi:hypothetical protein